MDQRSVLIIDDEEDCCTLISSFFKKKNYLVFIAHTIEEGLQLLKLHRPVIVFLDNNLPDGFGWEKAHEILAAYPGIQLHLFSAYKNADHYLKDNNNFIVWEKPLSVKHLEAALPATHTP
ncbi:MAG: response regulator [Chitinophagaceae bacterium]|nr:response regulator [Chitinophagaceae bacterium]